MLKDLIKEQTEAIKEALECLRRGDHKKTWEKAGHDEVEIHDSCKEQLKDKQIFVPSTQVRRKEMLRAMSDLAEEDFVMMLPERDEDDHAPSLDEITNPPSPSRPNLRTTRKVNCYKK